MFESSINFTVNSKVFKKDPISSELGKKIIQQSIELIEELGFEKFNFKKLAFEINSTEASIYRYFESKHNLLIYLIIWYWKWMQYQLLLKTQNIECPKIKLINCVTKLVEIIEEDNLFQQVNEVKLQKIVISESSKIYLHKNVEADNVEGFFKPYKDTVQFIADIIQEIQPNYKYPHMLVSTIIEGSHHQRFFAEHLPKLTDIISNEDSITSFYCELIKKELNLES
jgi:AcrR family transcriptional regulator